MPTLLLSEDGKQKPSAYRGKRHGPDSQTFLWDVTVDVCSAAVEDWPSHSFAPSAVAFGQALT